MPGGRWQDRSRRLRRRSRALRAAGRRCRSRTSSAGPGTERASSASAGSPSARTSCGSRARSSGVARARSRSSATARCAVRSQGGPVFASWAVSPTTRCRPGSPPPTSSASRASSEPFGLATLEAMASARSVVASAVGGPPEFVTPAAGVLVDPLDDDALVAALSEAAALPRPNLAGREAAARARRQAAGGAGGGDPPPSRSRSASLTSTSGRIESSRPASRATARASSYVSRTFSWATPCLSRLSPVTSSFWTRSRASSAT